MICRKPFVWRRRVVGDLSEEILGERKRGTRIDRAGRWGRSYRRLSHLRRQRQEAEQSMLISPESWLKSLSGLRVDSSGPHIAKSITQFFLLCVTASLFQRRGGIGIGHSEQVLAMIRNLGLLLCCVESSKRLLEYTPLALPESPLRPGGVPLLRFSGVDW